MIILKGTPVSPGIGLGRGKFSGRKPHTPGGAASPAFGGKAGTPAAASSAAGEPAVERIELFRWAVQQAGAEITRLTEDINQRLGAGEAEILRAQLLFLEDPLLKDEVERLMTAGMPVGQAVAAAAEKFAEVFAASEDDLLRERAADIRDVAARLAVILDGAGAGGAWTDGGPAAVSAGAAERGDGAQTVGSAGPDGGVVLLADELFPSLVAALDPAQVRGLAAGSGGYTSHAAIIARAMGIPAVMGLGRQLRDIGGGVTLLVDGDRGEVLVDPGAQLIKEYLEKAGAPGLRAGRKAAAPAAGLVSTGDGICLEVYANAGSLTEARLAREAGAAGIGLYRTEYTYLKGDRWPDEAQLAEEYASVADLWPEGTVVFRTFDLGGDKLPPYIELPAEENPMLGPRGIRLARRYPEHFMAQLRAVVRASRHGRVKVMIPMVSRPDELLWSRNRLMEAGGIAGCEELPPIGMMVEIPAAVLQLDKYTETADFFSLGTNDLMQYALVVDRMREEPGAGKPGRERPYFHPGFLRLLQIAVTGAGEIFKPIGICGEMAGDLRALPLLIGMGLRSFSAGVDRLVEVKEFLTGISAAECGRLTRKALQLATSEEVGELLGNHFPASIY